MGMEVFRRGQLINTVMNDSNVLQYLELIAFVRPMINVL